MNGGDRSGEVSDLAIISLLSASARDRTIERLHKAGIKGALTVLDGRCSGQNHVLTFRRPGQLLEPETTISRMQYSPPPAGQTRRFHLNSKTMPRAPWLLPKRHPSFSYVWELVLYDYIHNEIQAKLQFQMAEAPAPPVYDVVAAVLFDNAGKNGTCRSTHLIAEGLRFTARMPADCPPKTVRIATFRRAGRALEDLDNISRLSLEVGPGATTGVLTAANFPRAPWSWTDPTQAPLQDVYDWEFVLLDEAAQRIQACTPLTLELATTSDTSGIYADIQIYGDPSACFSREYLAGYGLGFRLSFRSQQSNLHGRVLTFVRPGEGPTSDVSTLACDIFKGYKDYFLSSANFPHAPWSWTDPSQPPLYGATDWQLVLYYPDASSPAVNGIHAAAPFTISLTDIVPPVNQPTGVVGQVRGKRMDSLKWSLPSDRDGIEKYEAQMRYVDSQSGRVYTPAWWTSTGSSTSLTQKSLSPTLTLDQIYTLQLSAKYPGAPSGVVGPTVTMNGFIPGVTLLHVEITATTQPVQYVLATRPPPAGWSSDIPLSFQYRAIFEHVSGGDVSLVLAECSGLPDPEISGSIAVKGLGSSSEISVHVWVRTITALGDQLNTRSADSPDDDIHCITSAPAISSANYDSSAHCVRFEFTQAHRDSQDIDDFFAALCTANEPPRYYALPKTSDSSKTGYTKSSDDSDKLKGRINCGELDAGVAYTLKLQGCTGPAATWLGVNTRTLFGPTGSRNFSTPHVSSLMIPQIRVASVVADGFAFDLELQFAGSNPYGQSMEVQICQFDPAAPAACAAVAFYPIAYSGDNGGVARDVMLHPDAYYRARCRTRTSTQVGEFGAFVELVACGVSNVTQTLSETDATNHVTWNAYVPAAAATITYQIRITPSDSAAPDQILTSAEPQCDIPTPGYAYRFFIQIQSSVSAAQTSSLGPLAGPFDPPVIEHLPTEFDASYQYDGAGRLRAALTNALALTFDFDARENLIAASRSIPTGPATEPTEPEVHE